MEDLKSITAFGGSKVADALEEDVVCGSLVINLSELKLPFKYVSKRGAVTTHNMAPYFFVASFNRGKKCHVERIALNGKGQLIVEARFQCGSINERGHLNWSQYPMATCIINCVSDGENKTGYHVCDYNDPLFMHRSEEEFMAEVNASYGTDQRLTITLNDNGNAISVAIITISNEDLLNWFNPERYGFWGEKLGEEQ